MIRDYIYLDRSFYNKSLEKENNKIKLDRFIFLNNPIKILLELLNKNITIMNHIYLNKKYIKNKYDQNDYNILDYMEEEFRNYLNDDFTRYFNDEDISKFILNSMKINITETGYFINLKNKKYSDDKLKNSFIYNIKNSDFSINNYRPEDMLNVEIWFHHPSKPIYYTEAYLYKNKLIDENSILEPTHLKHKHGFQYNNKYKFFELYHYIDNESYIQNCLIKHIHQIITKKEIEY